MYTFSMWLYTSVYSSGFMRIYVEDLFAGH